MQAFGSNQTMRLTTGFLDTVNDPTPGAVLASPSGMIVQPYTGFVGGIFTFSAKEALALSSAPATTNLYGGQYQYVQFKSDAAAANVRGQLVFWSDYDNGIVTPDGAATNSAMVAGVALNAVTKGNYGFIQVAGKASLKGAAAITKGVPAINDLVVVDVSAGVGLADVLDDATAIVSPNLKLAVGVAVEAMAAGALKLAYLNLPLNFCQR